MRSSGRRARGALGSLSRNTNTNTNTKNTAPKITASPPRAPTFPRPWGRAPSAVARGLAFPDDPRKNYYRATTFTAKQPCLLRLVIFLNNKKARYLWRCGIHPYHCFEIRPCAKSLKGVSHNDSGMQSAAYTSASRPLRRNRTRPILEVYTLRHPCIGHARPMNGCLWGLP